MRKKKPMMITCQDQLESSVYSQIGRDGLRFLQHNIKVGKDGLTQVTGQSHTHYQPLKLEDIQTSGINLGVGAAGVVVQGLYKPMGIQVAIKKINVFDREKRHQLMNDITTLLQNKINSENNGNDCQFFVNLYGAFYEQGNVKVVLQLMDAGSLNDILNIFKMANLNKLPLIEEPYLAQIAIQILNGLMYLHVVNRQVHRDIKPANILMNSQGEVQLTDFGIMKELEGTNQFCQTFLGTKAYMSPQRIEGQSYDQYSDIWSFGLIFYQLALGTYPYPNKASFIELLQLVVNESSPSIPDDGQFSKEFIDFINKCLQKDPKQRASAIELMSHPWILNNYTQGTDLSEWLFKIKQEILPILEMKNNQQI